MKKYMVTDRLAAFRPSESLPERAPAGTFEPRVRLLHNTALGDSGDELHPAFLAGRRPRYSEHIPGAAPVARGTTMIVRYPSRGGPAFTTDECICQVLLGLTASQGREPGD